MTDQKRTIWEDLAEVGREIVEQIGELIDPNHKRREPARVPIPVRNNPQRRDSQDSSY